MAMPESLRDWHDRMDALRDGVKEYGRGELAALIREAGISQAYFYAAGDRPTRRVALALDDACGGELLDPPEREWAEGRR